MLQFEKQNSIFWVNNETGKEKKILLDTQKRYYIYTPIFDWFCERRTKNNQKAISCLFGSSPKRHLINNVYVA